MRILILLAVISTVLVNLGRCNGGFYREVQRTAEEEFLIDLHNAYEKAYNEAVTDIFESELDSFSELKGIRPSLEAVIELRHSDLPKMGGKETDSAEFKRIMSQSAVTSSADFYPVIGLHFLRSGLGAPEYVKRYTLIPPYQIPPIELNLTSEQISKYLPTSWTVPTWTFYNHRSSDGAKVKDRLKDPALFDAIYAEAISHRQRYNQAHKEALFQSYAIDPLVTAAWCVCPPIILCAFVWIIRRIVLWVVAGFKSED